MPGWVTRFRYAEQFHISPHKVGEVPLLWWYRWLMLRDTEAAREVMRTKGKGKLDPEDQALHDWAMIEDKY